MDQMRAEAALTIVRALGVRTVTGSELHGSLLMQTVCCASGVYRERSRLSLVRIHTRYRGTAPYFAGAAECCGHRRSAGRRHLPWNMSLQCRIDLYQALMVKRRQGV